MRPVVGVLGLVVLALGLTATQVQTATPGRASASLVAPAVDAPTMPADVTSCATVTLALTLGPTACQVQVTAEGSAYDYAVPSDGNVIVTASKASGANNREFFWSSASPVERDASACATFVGGNGQPGLALRISQASSPDRTMGITVAENFLYHVGNVFNFDLWDSSQPLAFTQFGQTKIASLPPHPPLPLSMCARTSGTTVQFVVWESGMTRPPWGDPTWGGQADLPSGAPTSGQTGFYAGHIEPGTSMMLGDLSVDGTIDNPVP